MARIRSGNPSSFARRKLVLLVAGALATGGYATAISLGPQESTAPLAVALRAPISFEPNRGQFRPEILYLARGVAGSVSLRAGEVAITPRGAGGASAPLSPDQFRFRLNGAHPSPEIATEEPLAARSNYYLGKDSSNYQQNVPHYGRVVMKDVYPSIDLALHGTQGALEYDFVVAPGANPRDIRLDLANVDAAWLGTNGDLVIQKGSETFRQHAPVAWQASGNSRLPVDARFVLAQSSSGIEATFALGKYDAARELVIDPVMSYSTFLGSTASDNGGYLAVDPTGRVYLAQNAAPDESSFGAAASAVVITKFDPATQQVIYSTTLAGSDVDIVNAIALGASGGAYATYVAGTTRSTDFPTCFALTDCAPHAGQYDAFVTILDPSGNPVFSRLLGGSASDGANALAVDAAGTMFLAGYSAGGFPMVGASAYPTYNGATDAIVAKVTRGFGLMYSTYLGGSASDVAYGIAIDGANNMYVSGGTFSPDFPHVGAFPSSTSGAFVTRIDASGASVDYSNLLGGSGDTAKAIALNPATNEVVVSGQTRVASFPQVGPPQTHAGNTDVFVSRFSLDGSALTMSTLLGGSSADFMGSIAVAPSGNVYLAGTTVSPDLPMLFPLATQPGGASQSVFLGPSSAFVALIGPTGTRMFTSYLGGSGDETANGIAIDVAGSAYVSGRTKSFNFPTVSPYQATMQGTSDLFVTRLFFDFSLTVASSGSGDGLIISMPSNIDCGTTCNSAFPAESVVTLTATPNATSLFGGWTGCPAPSGNQCTATMSKDRFVSAYFTSTITGLPARNDFNGDGKSDLLWKDTSAGSTQGWLMNGLTATQIAGLLPATGFSVSHVADLNGDGKADLIISHPDGTLVGWQMNGLSVSVVGNLLSAGSGWSVVATGDLNGDGKADLFLQHTDGRVMAWIMNGPGVTSSATFVPAGTGWSISKVADLNGDGKADLIWQHTDGTVQAWLMDGTTATQVATFVGAGSGWSVARAGDFNGDGKVDLLWQNVDGSTQAWLMDGLGVMGLASFTPAGTGWSPVLTGDISGDGKADIFWEHTSGASQTWLMDGTTATSLATFVPAGTGWTASHLYDLDGDGKQDVLWKHTSGAVQAWLMNGLTITQLATLAGAGTYQVTPPAP